MYEAIVQVVLIQKIEIVERKQIVDAQDDVFLQRLLELTLIIVDIIANNLFKLLPLHEIIVVPVLVAENQYIIQHRNKDVVE